jgi:hypothetical protein
MNSEKHLQDIIEIRRIMERSGRFLSLSGLSGILAGIFALTGSVAALIIVNNSLNPSIINWGTIKANDTTGIKLIAVGMLVLFASLISGFVLTRKKAKRLGQNMWDSIAKKAAFNFSIPLITGGLFCLIMLNHGTIGMLSPATLIFYGLALVNAGKFMHEEITYLGISEIILGLIALNFIGYGIYFWMIGFGLLHILYGIILYVKYDKVE